MTAHTVTAIKSLGNFNPWTAIFSLLGSMLNFHKIQNMVRRYLRLVLNDANKDKQGNRRYQTSPAVCNPIPLRGQ